MTVLVAYASRHGSTAGIADRVAANLRGAGLEAEAHPVDAVRGLDQYDAVVVGGAAYMFHWMKDAAAFVRRYQQALSEKPVWLFSSGPLGIDDVDAKGRDVFEASRPREWADLPDLVGARGTKVFRGAWDSEAPVIGFGERLMHLIPKAKTSVPVGDFREWAEIDAWADGIASALRTARVEPR